MVDLRESNDGATWSDAADMEIESLLAAVHMRAAVTVRQMPNRVRRNKGVEPFVSPFVPTKGKLRPATLRGREPARRTDA